jgi:hypothetical protein
VAKGRQRFFPTALVAWRSPPKEPRRSLDELEWALDLRALLHGRQQIPIGAEGNWHAHASEVIGK